MRFQNYWDHKNIYVYIYIVCIHIYYVCVCGVIMVSRILEIAISLAGKFKTSQVSKEEPYNITRYYLRNSFVIFYKTYIYNRTILTQHRQKYSLLLCWNDTSSRNTVYIS